MKSKNEIKVNKRKLLGITALLMCLIVMHFYDTNKYDIQSNYTFFASITLIELIVFSFFNTKLNKSIFNFAFIFALCLYLFNFGQVVLMGFFPEACDSLTIVLTYFNETKLFYALKILNSLVVVIYITILLFTEKNKEKNKENSIMNNEEYLKKKSFLIIYFTFPVKLAIDLTMLYIGVTKGFSASKSFLLNIPDILVTFGNFSILGFYLWMISLKNKKSEQKKLFIFIIIYIMLIMLTGRRSENVAYICIFAYIYLSNKKINLKNLIIVVLMTFIGFAFLYALVYNRAYSVGIVNSLIHVLTNNNIIFEVLREYGNTAYTSIIVITDWLPKNSIAYGKSYFMGLSAIIPNFFGIMGNLTRMSNYGFTLQNSGILYKQYTNIGGALIGELLFNFGKTFSIIGAGIVGYIVAKTSKKTQDLIMGTTDYSIMYYLAMMAGILYWIRDYFSGMIREIVWGIIFCWFISKIKIKKRKINEKN